MTCSFCRAGDCGADVHLTQGDLGPSLVKTIYGPDGRSPQDLTGATVTVEIQRADLSGRVFGGACSFVGAPTLGVVQYAWQAGDTAVPGLYRYKFKMVFGSVPIHWPRSGTFFLRIEPDLESEDLPVTPPPATAAFFISLDGINSGLEQLIALSTTSLDSGSLAWVESPPDYFVFEKAATFTADNENVVAGLGGGQWLRWGFTLPVTADPSVSPGLSLPVGFRVRKQDGTAAWDKFGTGATDWAVVANGTDATARAAAAAAQTTANSATTAAAAANALATAAEADAQTAIALANAAGGIQRFATVAAMTSYAGSSLDARCADVRDEFYADPASSLPTDAVTIRARVAGGRWIRKCLGDLYWQQQREFWYDAGSLGSDGNSGAYGSPIKTIGELGLRTKGLALSAPGLLYTAANLTDSESALFASLTTQWTVISGAMPLTPKFYFDPNNFNGANNVGLTGGQSLAAVNWVNLGSASGIAIPSGSGMTLKAIASAGNLRNSASVAFNGGGFFRTGPVAGLGSPITWVVVVRINSAGTYAFVDGRTSTERNMFYSSGGNFQLYGGGSAGLQNVGTVVPNKYHYATAAFVPPGPGPQAIGAANFVVSDGQYDVGACAQISGVTLGAGGDGSALLNGELVVVLGLDGNNSRYNMNIWDNWVQYKLGAASTWPQ